MLSITGLTTASLTLLGTLRRCNPHLATTFVDEACQELETTTVNCQMGTLPLATGVVHEHHFQPDMRLSAAAWPSCKLPNLDPAPAVDR
jgi:hypothetical protein